MPAIARQAVPRLAGAALTRVVPAVVRTTVSDLARQIAARGITRSVANRLAAQALRGASGRALRQALTRAAVERGVPALAGQSVRAVQSALAREIEAQLLRRFTNRAAVEVVEQGSAAVIREFAAAQVARVTLGRELAGYVGIRVAFGAGFMGGGNLAGQLMQVSAGNRAELEWGQVWQGAAEGAAFAAGMWGGPIGHTIGGAASGAVVSGAHEAYEHFALGERFDWADVGHGAFQGAVAGSIFGTQNHLETTRWSGGLRIGGDVHVLRNEGGGLNILAADSAGRRVVITDTGQFAYERRVDGGVERGWSEGFTRESGIRVDVSDRPAGAPHDTSPARLGDAVHALPPGDGPRPPAVPTAGASGPRVVEPVRAADAGPQTVERVRVPAGERPVPVDGAPVPSGLRRRGIAHLYLAIGRHRPRTVRCRRSARPPANRSALASRSARATPGSETLPRSANPGCANPARSTPRRATPSPATPSPATARRRTARRRTRSTTRLPGPARSAAWIPRRLRSSTARSAWRTIRTSPGSSTSLATSATRSCTPGATRTSRSGMSSTTPGGWYGWNARSTSRRACASSTSSTSATTSCR